MCRTHAIRTLAVVSALAALTLTGCSSDEGGTPNSTSTTAPASTASTTAPAEAKPIRDFSGSGDKTTGSFAAAPNWEVRWRTSPGNAFTIELLTKDGTSRGQIVDAAGKAEGSTFVSEGGEFQLKVVAASDWSIQVVGRAEGG